MSRSFILLIMLIVSCTPKKINRYIRTGDHQLRHGYWEEKYDSEQGMLVSKGKYSSGEKVGTWNLELDGKKYQKDVIKIGIIKTRIYHPNGKIMEKGQSRTDISANERVWYYYGDWKYYNERGKLLYIKKYEKGSKVDSIPHGKKS